MPSPRPFPRPPRPRAAAPRFRPAVEALESRLVPYALSGDAWPSPKLITISFVPDGTILGSNGSGYITSNLFATWNARFGSASAWQNQILQAAQAWAQQTNINFAVVPDNGAALGSGNYQQGDPGMGDIRIGGDNFGSSTLAQAEMPPPANNYSVAGDVQFNTGQPFNLGTTYDLYTVAVHEIGHALGLYHSGTYSAAMYGAYTGVKCGLSSDDIAGIRAIYGNGAPRSPDANDAGATPNGTFAAATNLTPQVNSTSLTALVTGLDLTTTSDADYYSVTAPAGTSGTLTLTVQSKGLSLLTPKVWVYAANQTTVLGSASGANQYGTTLTVKVANVTAGQQLYVKVAGADTSPMSTGAYALTLNFGTGAAPAVPLPSTTLADGSPLSAGGGQASTVSTEFLVNTTTGDVQQTSNPTPHTVAMDAAGDSVVTWSSHNEDGSGWGVYARRYDASGDPLGGEFRVNTTTANDQLYSNVAMDGAGAFVITWSSNGQDGGGWGVYGQRYDASGNPQGGEFRVNTTTAGDQTNSDVALDGNGNFVITWASNKQDGNGWGVYGQRYDSLGNRLGGEFRVNTTTAGDQEYATVAVNPGGTFLVTWSSNGQDGGGWGVYAQRYDASGNPQGGEFRVNTTTAGDQLYPAAALDSLGNFVVTWSSNGQDGGGWGAYAKWFNASGVAQGDEFRVNTTTAGDQEYSAVALDPSGNFLITWSSNNQDGNGWGVYAQQYAAGGTPLGNEFRVNTTTSGNQQNSSVALDGHGDALVAWSGNGVGDTAGVFAQRYAVPAGSTGAASSSLVPGAVGDTFEPGGGGTVAGPGAANDPIPAGLAAGPGHHHRHARRPELGAWLGLDQPQRAQLVRQWLARVKSYVSELVRREV